MNAKRRPKRSKGTKGKRPKFLSLRLQFPAGETTQLNRPGARQSTAASAAVANPDPSPIRSQDQAEERESNDHENENVAFFFSAADGGATTLTGLLDPSTAAESISSHTEKNSSRLEYLPAAYGEDRAALVRNALRSRDRDSSEDKWVCYSEVVKEEEVSSSSAVGPPGRAGFQRVSLKLDYEEIMNAWSNKGPLYVDNSQIVPDMNQHDFLSQEFTNIHGLMWGCNNSSWVVPEMGGKNDNGEAKRNEEWEMKMGQREASVLRYKEKRQNRLFSRKIRYQVRKLNAEKRPRIKGRFVKRS